MTVPSYRNRTHPFARERTYRLGEEAIEITDGVRTWSVGYSHIKLINSLRVRFLGSSIRYRQLNLHAVGAQRPIVICAGERHGLRVVDRTDEVDSFDRELKQRVASANAGLDYVYKRSPLNRAGGLVSRVAAAFLRLMRRTRPDRWADVAAAIMRRVGPRLDGNRRVLRQLALAFPEKPHAELERIAVAVWDNIARTVVEYSHLNRLWDYDPVRPNAGRLVMDEASARIWADIQEAGQPVMGFSMHSANWELTAIAIARHGLKALIPYRRSQSERVTDELVRIRTDCGCTPLRADGHLIGEIRRQFRPGAILGMLFDQFYPDGIEVTLFGQPTKLNPMFARLARIYDCQLYGSRIVRLPDRRLRYEIVGPIEPVRDARGRVDVQPTMQLLATMMEGWIREYPDQWLWLHRIWR